MGNIVLLWEILIIFGNIDMVIGNIDFFFIVVYIQYLENIQHT